jgi:hypothetical protein
MKPAYLLTDLPLLEYVDPRRYLTGQERDVVFLIELLNRLGSSLSDESNKKLDPDTSLCIFLLHILTIPPQNGSIALP